MERRTHPKTQNHYKNNKKEDADISEEYKSKLYEKKSAERETAEELMTQSTPAAPGGGTEKKGGEVSI